MSTDVVFNLVEALTRVDEDEELFHTLAELFVEQAPLDEDRPIGRRASLLLPQYGRVFESIDKHHSVEEIVAGRFTRAVYRDQIDCTSNHARLALHRRPPGTRGRRTRGPARLLRDEHAATEIFLSEKINRLARRSGIIDEPSPDPLTQDRFHRTIPS